MKIPRCRAGRPQPWSAGPPVRPLALLAAASGLLALSTAAGARPTGAHRTAVPIVSVRSVASRREAQRTSAGQAPRISAQPTPVYAAPGTAVRFAATATGSPRPTVHWQISTDHGASWRNIDGARKSSFSFIAAVHQDDDRFRAVFKNRHGTAHTSGVLLTVVAGYAEPLIQTEPQGTTVVLGAEASFTAAAAGDPTPAVQWQLSADGGTTWSNLTGATQTTLTFATTATMNGYKYRAVFTNVLGAIDTTAATLTISGPVITGQPQSEDVGTGYPVSFAAAASGLPAPSVQWQVSVNHGVSWSNIPGATATTYSFDAAANQNLNEYQAVFSNSLGTATTEPAILGVGYALTSNWSGYASVLANTQYTAVSGSWVVPSVNATCAQTSNSSSSQWVGIDGASSTTVEQTGTYSDCAGPGGTTPTYGAWYEMLGDAAVSGGAEVNVTTITPSDTIEPGDTMTASVSVNGNDQWALTIADSTSPRVWSFTETPLITWSAPAEASAEWIVERPETCIGEDCTLTSLADFGTAAFTTASAASTSGSIEAAQSTPIEMIRSGTDSTLLAGPPTLAGSGFNVPWVANS
jgi:hypothetical protein